jgi:hypothetical protein
MRFMRAVVAIGGLAPMTVMLACGFGSAHESDFPVAVANLSPHSIRVSVNGVEIGDVGAEQSRAFSVRLPESGSSTRTASGTLTSPTPVAFATFTAQDLIAGFSYAGTTATLSQNGTTFVEFKLECPDDPAKKCTAFSRIVPSQ